MGSHSYKPHIIFMDDIDPYAHSDMSWFIHAMIVMMGKGSSTNTSMIIASQNLLHGANDLTSVLGTAAAFDPRICMKADTQVSNMMIGSDDATNELCSHGFCYVQTGGPSLDRSTVGLNVPFYSMARKRRIAARTLLQFGCKFDDKNIDAWARYAGVSR